MSANPFLKHRATTSNPYQERFADSDRELDLIERYELIRAWVNRDREPHRFWPGEPDDELERATVKVVCDCGAHVPYADFYTIPDGPYRERHCCLDCMLQSRAGAPCI